MADSFKRSVKRKLSFNDDIREESDDIYDSDDSVKDKDYSDTSATSDSSDSSEISTSSSGNSGPKYGENNNSKKELIVQRDIPITPEKEAKSRWRQKNISGRNINKRKTRRDAGQQYVNKSGKIIASRQMGPSCTCKKKCRTLLSGKEADIFHSFWNIANYNQQNMYLFSTIKAAKPKRRYPKKTKRAESSRTTTMKYFVKVNGEDIKVCKQEFLSIHGLQNSQKRIQLICEQIRAGRTTPTSDRRGTHENRSNKIPENIAQSVVDHINSIPTYTSHYSRHKNPDKVYLDCDLNISTLYNDYYLDWCKNHNITPASADKYRRIFCKKFNIGFKLPRSDTCKTCDKLHIDIEACKDNIEKCNKMKVDLALHQARAESIQTSLKEEVKKGKDNKRDVISFDLQQALPTPNLTVGPAFYLRKLWTYNLGIHDCINGKGFMYMWSEDIGKRGSDEICSIILKYIKDHPPKNDELIIYTDNCGGQNKNWKMMALWLQLVREKIYLKIEHRFLISGHTHLPSDRDFAHIEKYKKQIKQVYAPVQWFEAVRKAKRTNPFEVTEMKGTDLYAFQPLVENINKKKVCEDKENFRFNNVRCFKFDFEYPNTMFIKYLYNEEFRSVNVGKRGRPANLNSLNDLKQKYSGRIEINSKKIADIKKLMPYIPPVYHDYYENMINNTLDEPIEESQPEHLDNFDEDYESDGV